MCRRVLICLSLVAAAAPALAEGSDKLTQAVNIQFDYGLDVHRSDTIDSMDFGAAYRVAVSTFAGKAKDIGLGLRRDSSSTTYTQTDSKVDVEWTDMVVGYRIFWFFPMIMLGSGSFNASLDGVDVVDSVLLTSGGGLSTRVPAGAIATAVADIMYVDSSATRDSTGSTVRIGQRTDVDLGVIVRLPWDNFDIYTGYRYRTYRVNIDGSGKGELETGPYLGFNLGFSP